MTRPDVACHVLFAAVALIFLQGTACAQKKVANFSYGAPGTEQYEHFSFRADHKRPAAIQYRYGKAQKEITLRFAGKALVAGRKGFKVLFPNKLVLYIIPGNKNINVRGENGSYNKIFTWEYEGPVNGIGTYCDVCTENETEAVALLKDLYLP